MLNSAFTLLLVPSERVGGAGGSRDSSAEGPKGA